jgi:predicted membrane-bound mannosyltransferase
MILLAGVGVGALFRRARVPALRAGLAVGLLAALAHLGVQARQVVGPFATDQRNPWVYAHTSKDLLRLVDRVLGIAQVHGDPARMEVNVLAVGGDYWPLPWYLRRLKETRWADGIPADPFAPVVIASARLHAALDEKSDKRWISAGYYEHRPRVFFELFVELELWKRYLAAQPPPEEDDP